MTDLVSSGAWGTGLATITADGTVLDVWYPRPTLGAAGGTDDGQPDLAGAERDDDVRGVRVAVVSTEIASLADAPLNTADAYLRLHLLSTRQVLPRSINLDGIFGFLPNNVWTDLGPVPVETIEQVRVRAGIAGIRLAVFGVDKFPRMTDYVVPPVSGSQMPTGFASVPIWQRAPR